MGTRPWSRGSPRLLATPSRWLATSAVLIGATLAAARAAAAWRHAELPALPVAVAVGFAAVAEALLVATLLRAEDRRLSRELRVARVGTPVLRALLGRRRSRVPFFMRLFATELGGAAVCLANGDESAARDLLAAESPWMDVGRMRALRTFVLADADRALGTSAARLRCIERLRTAPRIGHREADLYRVYVLVRAILELGEADSGLEVAMRLAQSTDPDERIYGIWLMVWFDLDAQAEGGDWPPLAEDQARLALLMARSQGAEALVDKLQARVATIARTPP